MDDHDNTNTGVFPCGVFPLWGEPGPKLDGAAIRALAVNMGKIGFAEDNVGASHWGMYTWDRQAFLTPIVSTSVVGHGACVHLTRQE